MALPFIAQSVGLALMGNLVDTCSSYLAASGMQDELDRLRYDLPQVQAVLTAVEDCAPAMKQNKGLRMWLWQINDALFNSEDVLCEVVYYVQKKRKQDGDDKVRCILSKCKRKIDSFIKGIFPDDILVRLKEAVKVLDKVFDRMGLFLQLAIGFYGPSVKRQKIEKVRNARETSAKRQKIEKVRNARETTAKRQKIEKVRNARETSVKRQKIEEVRNARETSVKRQKIEKVRNACETSVKHQKSGMLAKLAAFSLKIVRLAQNHPLF